MSDVVRTESASIREMTGDPVDVYIARTEQLRRIAEEEQASESLIFGYDARRQAAISVAQDADAIFRLAERRPDLVKQLQADVAAQDMIDTLQRPPTSSVIGSGGAQALADAPASLEALRLASAAPESAEEAARARAFFERDMERIIWDPRTFYELSKQDPATARAVLAAVYEPAEMDAAALALAARQAERWRAADAQVAAAAERQDPDALAPARQARDRETERLVRNPLAIYALGQSATPLSARAELALAAEARARMGGAPDVGAEVDREMRKALGARAGDPAARYAWLAEEAMAADAGIRRVGQAPFLRQMAKEEARKIEEASSSGDLGGKANLTLLAKERPWLARSFRYDRMPKDPQAAPGTAGRTPDLEDYAAEQAAAGSAGRRRGRREGDGTKQDSAGSAGRRRGRGEGDGTKQDSAGTAHPGEQADRSAPSLADLVNSRIPLTDADLARKLQDPKTSFFALPFAEFSGSPTVDRELDRLYKQDKNRFWSLFENTRNLMLDILKHPGGVEALSETDREAVDHLQLGLRALARAAVKANKKNRARVEDPLMPLISANGQDMITKAAKKPIYHRALCGPDGVPIENDRIQVLRKDRRIKEDGLLSSARNGTKEVGRFIGKVIDDTLGAVVEFARQ
jgi:hypothetical protein